MILGTLQLRINKTGSLIYHKLNIDSILYLPHNMESGTDMVGSKAHVGTGEESSLTNASPA